MAEMLAEEGRLPMFLTVKPLSWDAFTKAKSLRFVVWIQSPKNQLRSSPVDFSKQS